MLGWDDYRIVLEIARGQGLAGAAQSLDVTLSTVYRRLERIEETMDARLFDRRKGNYEPTDAGRAIVDAAERMETEALAADRTVIGRDQQLTGSLRITATELFATCFLARHLPGFRARHPGLDVEVFADNRRLSLADREADLTLRVGRPNEPALFGRTIGTMMWGMYGNAEAARRLPASGSVEDFREELFLGWEGSPPSATIAAWLDAHHPDARYLCRTTSLIANAALAAAGPAIAPLPCILGETWPGLHALIKPLDGLGAELWLLVHEDMRRNARVRALMDFLTDAAGEDRRLLLGEV